LDQDKARQEPKSNSRLEDLKGLAALQLTKHKQSQPQELIDQTSSLAKHMQILHGRPDLASFLNLPLWCLESRSRSFGKPLWELGHNSHRWFLFLPRRACCRWVEHEHPNMLQSSLGPPQTLEPHLQLIFLHGRGGLPLLKGQLIYLLLQLEQFPRNRRSAGRHLECVLMSDSFTLGNRSLYCARWRLWVLFGGKWSCNRAGRAATRKGPKKTQKAIRET